MGRVSHHKNAIAFSASSRLGAFARWLKKSASRSPHRPKGGACYYWSLAKGGKIMFLGIGNIVALVCIIISVIFAVVTHQATNALWWALLAIFAVLWWDARAPWGRP